MEINVFLSHSHLDKLFVNKLARDLENHNIKYWLDKTEIERKAGNPLPNEIMEGINTANHFAIILSPNSVKSIWVFKELDMAMNLKVNKKIKILPIMLEDCKLPDCLEKIIYIDFKKEDKYIDSFKILVNTIGLVFNASVMSSNGSNNNLGTAINKAMSFNLPLMSKPFYRPFQYIGMSVQKAEEIIGIKENDVGNIIIENKECHMLLEAEGNFISYIEVDIKRTAPHYQNKEFDSEFILGVLSIGLTELDLVEKQIHNHKYYDHRRKLKITVSCPYDGAPLTVTFGTKYYGM